MSDAFREIDTVKFNNQITFVTGFGVIADQTFQVGSLTTQNSNLVTYNTIIPWGGISGFGSSGELINSNIFVKTTGNQTISGVKNFQGDMKATSITSNGNNGTDLTFIDFLNRQIWDNDLAVSLDWQLRQLRDAISATAIDWNNRILSGTWNVQALRMSGVSVATGQGGGGGGQDMGAYNLVYTTGAQNINNLKTFSGVLFTGYVSGTAITGHRIRAINSLISPSLSHPTNAVAIDLTNGQLTNDAAVISLDWNNYQTKDSAEEISINWSNRLLNGNWLGTGLNILSTLKISGQTVITGDQGASGILSNRLYQTGADLIGLINASAGGVSTLNNASGILTVTGTGIITVISGAVGLIYISGNNNDAINLSGRLYSTGSTLYNYITSTSGNLDTRIYQTGSNLYTSLNNATGYINSNPSGYLTNNAFAPYNFVFTTGNQTVNGIKTFGTGIIQPGQKNHFMLAELSTTLNDTVEFARFTFSNGGSTFDVNIVVPSSSFSVSKQYKIAIGYAEHPDGWFRVIPISSTGPYSGNDFDLEIKVANDVVQFRIRRISGSHVGSCYISITENGAVPFSTVSYYNITGVSGVVSSLYNNTLISQLDGKIVLSGNAYTDSGIYYRGQLLSTGVDISAYNFVFTTGAQNVNNLKTFSGALFTGYFSGINITGYRITAMNAVTSNIYTANNGSSIDMFNQQMTDANVSVVVLDWGTQRLIDQTENPSLDWNNRLLINDWTATGINALQTLKISGQSVITGGNIPTRFYTGNATGSFTPAIGQFTIDWSSGNTFNYTLTGNTQINFINDKDGQTIVLGLGNTGNVAGIAGNGMYTGIWPRNVRWPSNTIPTQTTGALAYIDIYTFIKMGTGIYGNVVPSFIKF